MQKFIVECGELERLTFQSSAGHAARKMMQFWVENHQTNFSSLVYVTASGEMPRIFSTALLLEALGIEFDKDYKNDRPSDPIYRPRLCEQTKSVS
jgi:hypothetical protein